MERLKKALTATPQAAELFRGFGGGFFAYPRSAYVDGAYIEATAATYAYMYANQESVRTVVDWIAGVSADRSIECLRYLTDGTKQREPGHPAARTIREPNDWQGQKEMLFALIADWLVYDDAYLWDLGPYTNQRRFLVRVPPHAMGVKSNNRLQPSGYRVMFADGTWLDLDPSEVIHLRGYSAADNRVGVPKMQTLRVILAESAARKAQAVEQIRGGNIKGGIVERPIEAPSWTQEGLERFAEHFADRLRGAVKGQVAVLDEGMKFVEAGITPREAEQVANRKLTLEVVAQTYGLNPALFSTSGNLGAARQAAEEDVIGPLLGRVAEAFTMQIIRAKYADDDHAFKFRPKRETDAAKLFEAGSKATGGSTLTTNEFRDEFLDRPPVEGGDEIVKHPGSTSGDIPPEPGAEDRGRPETTGNDVDKSYEALKKSMERISRRKIEREEEAKSLARRDALKSRRDRAAAEHAEILRNHFRRQQRSKAALTDERWTRELASDLLKAGNAFVENEGNLTAFRLLGKFDMNEVKNYMRAGAKAVAEAINTQTVQDYEEARAREDVKSSLGEPGGKSEEPESETDTRKRILDDAIGERSEQLGMSRATSLSAFAVHEAARQNPGPPGIKRQKVWVWSGSANSRHGDVAGQEVDLFKPFGNGMQFPGDPKADLSQTARCKCALDVF